MRKIVLLLVLFSIGAIAFSQEITVRFTGQLNGTSYCRLDSVKVTNITRDWTETVEYPDTIIVLGGTVGTDLNIAATQGLGQNIPNPFDCETRVELSVSQRENVRMQLLDVSGKHYAEYSGSLDAGVHTFDISAAAPQTYVLNATVGSRSYSIRMVNMGSGCGSSIKYAGISGSITAKLTSANEFNIGDNMRYVGYATIDNQMHTSEPIEQAQYVSQYITLHFTRNERPVVQTLVATEITSYSAILNGNVVSDGGATITARGFFYGTSADNLSQMVTASGMDADFSTEISGLNSSTTYYFKAFATNANGTSFGELKTFTTLTMVRPIVVTLAATDITITSARLNGNITENNASVTARGFQLGVSENDLSVSLPINTTDATFSMNVPGLEANTTYYFRAYATDEFGTVYGEIMGFTTTSIVAPTVSTLAVTGVTYTTATLAGSITSDGGASVTECGFRYSTSAMFSSYETITCTSVSNSFGYSLEGLNAGTTYYVKAYATNEVGTSLGEVQNFTTDSYLTPAVTTLAASGITISSATLNGTITSVGGAEITERGFVYSASPLFGTSSTITSNNETDNFSASIYELEPSTTYYYKAYAINSVGTTYGEILNFTTLSIGNPSVETYAATNVSYTGATINGAVVSDGGASITGRGFYYGTSENNLSEQVTAGIGASNFNVSLEGLADNTTYYYKAYATNSAGTAYGNILNFITHEILVPTVETRAASEITRVSAKLNGEITADGGSDVTARGIIYSQYSNFTTYETVNTALTSNVFYVNVESLTPVTTYYYKAFATNSRGTAYGQIMQFTTLEFYLPTILTNDATDVTISSATLNGNITSDGGSTVTAKGFQYGISAGNLANTVSLGMGAGILTTTISNLDDNTTYYYRAYASNTQGTAYGETKTFTTIGIVAPSITTLPATDNTRNSLTLNASITSNGGATVSARGFYWGTAENDLPNYVASAQTTANFSATISDLAVNTVYYYCAAATNIRGTSLGEVLYARTNPATAPTVTTNAATNLTRNTATINATITDDGGSAVTVRGFYWGTSADNLVNNVISTSTGNSFSANLTGLTFNTTYYYCAYATNSTSTAIGSIMSFIPPCECGRYFTVTDYDGNQYGTVLIGEQCWMSENLKSTHYANGASISLGTSLSNETAYRYYPNNYSSHVTSYGYLYNWTAAMHGASSSSANPSNVQGICPNGWHLPSDAEWTQLTNYLSSHGEYQCGGTSTKIAKSLASRSGWDSSSVTCDVGNNPSSNNSTGFNAVPAGYNYSTNLVATRFGTHAHFWSATIETSKPKALFIEYLNSKITRIGYEKYYGLSVRCVRNE